MSLRTISPTEENPDRDQKFPYIEDMELGVQNSRQLEFARQNTRGEIEAQRKSSGDLQRIALF